MIQGMVVNLDAKIYFPFKTHLNLSCRIHTNSPQEYYTFSQQHSLLGGLSS